MENQQLREALSQVTVKYNKLQTDFVSMVQQHQSNDGDEVPKSFMDLSLAAPAAVETDDNSQSSSEGKSHDEQPRSPPESNKVPRLSCSKNNPNTSIDQATEATIRKARVSVRARSEAPTVHINELLIKFSLFFWYRY